VLKQIYFGLALSWTLFVAFLCLASFNSLPRVSLQNADKYVHFTFHFVFTFLWFLYFNQKNNKSNYLNLFLVVFFLSFSYGIGVEIMQGLFTSSRKADVFDVVANTTGSIAAISLISLYHIVKKK
jgi:VanZ family protein